MPLMIPSGPHFSRYENNITATPALSTGTSVTNPAGAAHTKNTTWTELIATSAFDAQLVLVTVSTSSSSNTDTSVLLDIGIGAASAESVLIPDLMAGWAAAGGAGRSYIFPLYVPSGSRISARTQSVRTTGGVNVLIELFGGPRFPDRWWYGHQVTAYGANTANSAGTKFTPGNSGAEGTGVSLGTTTAAHDCFVLGVQGHPDDSSWGALVYHFDVGIDSSSTEWFATDRFYATSTATESIATMLWWPLFNALPSGTELMVRGECSGTADALSAAIYGVS